MTPMKTITSWFTKAPVAASTAVRVEEVRAERTTLVPQDELEALASRTAWTTSQPYEMPCLGWRYG